MKESDKFYLMKLYPFQDGILKILSELNLPFYLTGGTALSRFYFNHRYSDDLDFFVNDDNKFDEYCKLIFDELVNAQAELNFVLDRKSVRKTSNHMQMFLFKDNIELKIDFVNDVAPHFGEFKFDNLNNRIDSLRNILSNKICAIYRFEPKDIADIWIICKNFNCEFVEILSEAKLKDASVDPVTIYEILISFPLDKLDFIKWVEEVYIEIFNKELKIIADDIFNGRKNSLAENYI